MTITIYGASDDGVVVREGGTVEEYDVHGGLWCCDLIGPGGEAMQIHIVNVPTGDGLWHAMVGQVDESVPLPTWPLRIVQSGRDYAVAVEVDVPSGTRIDNIASKEL